MFYTLAIVFILLDNSRDNSSVPFLFQLSFFVDTLISINPPVFVFVSYISLLSYYTFQISKFKLDSVYQLFKKTIK